MLQLTRIVSVVAAVVLAASCSDMPSNPARGTTMAPQDGPTPSSMTSGACQTAPTLISEEFLPDGRVKFKWDQQDNQCRLHHWFELRVDATDAVVESDEPFVIENNGLFEYTRGAGLSGIMYKWRVRNAFSDLIWGPYSPYRLFTPPAPTTLSVSPSSATTCPGRSKTLTATVLDQNGNVWTAGTVGWSSANTSIATATSTGSRTADATGVATGQVAVTATLDGATGQSTITVGSCPSVTVTGPTSVQPGATCSWFANASGGTPPYNYAWNPVGNNSSELTYTNHEPNGGSFNVTVTVSDANALVASGTRVVSVSSTAHTCTS